MLYTWPVGFWPIRDRVAVSWGCTRMIVAGKALGRKRPLFADWGVPLPPRGGDDGNGDGSMTLRDLITHVVAFEVGAFKQRHEARRLDRVLLAQDIEVGEAAGRVSPEGRETSGKVDEAEAIGAALQAFEDGMYLVVIDGQEQRDLDAQVFCHEDSRITFVRLVFLAGA